MSNLLQPYFDLCWESGRVFFTWLFDGWIKEKKDLNIFFKSIGLKNKLEEYPMLFKEINNGYLVTIPVGLNAGDFIKHKNSLETYLNREVDIQNKNGLVYIEYKVKKLKENIPYEQNKRIVSHIKFDIGESIDSIVTLDLKENPHSYIVGTTGSGKSVMTKVILSNLISLYRPSELELYLADLKRVELNLFRNVKHCKKFVYTVEATTEVIADLLEETNRRYDLFMEHEVTNIFEYNKLPNVKKLKYQVLYIEEIVMLLEDKKKRAMKLLKQLIAISRASGLYVFLTTQRPSNDIIDNVVKANINNRIVLKCEDSKNSVVALDREGAELLRGNGHGIIKRGCQNEEFQAYYISDEEVKKIIKPFIKPKSENKSSNDKLINECNEVAHNSNNKVTDTKGNNIIDLSFIDNL